MKKRLMALVLCLTVMMTMFAPLANATEEDLLSTPTPTPAPAAATVEPQAESAHESAAPTAAHTEQPSAQPAETVGQPVATAAPAATAVPAETAASPVEEAVSGMIAVTAGSDVNLRTAPGRDSESLGKIAQSGTAVKPLKKVTLPGGEVWYAVEYEGCTGYIFGDLLTLSAAPAAAETPAAAATPETQETPETPAPVITEPDAVYTYEFSNTTSEVIYGYQATATLGQSVSVPRNGRVVLSGPAGQWQILVGGVWADLAGADSSVALTYALLKNAGSSTRIRCLDAAGNPQGESAVTLTDAVSVAAPAQEPVLKKTPLRAAAPAAVVANADDETPVADTFVVTIDYKFANGIAAADSWTATIAKGGSLKTTVKSPEVVGYTPDQAEVTLDESDISDNITKTVFYSPANVGFKVEHYWQNLDDDEYALHEQELKDGNTDSVVGNGLAKKYDGFSALLYDATTKVAAAGNTVVKIYYDRNYYLLSLDLDGGYGAEPVYGRYGASISVANPTKPGYIFGGWNPTIPGTMPAENKTCTAKWTLKDAVDFTVVFWYENADDANYSYAGSITDQAKAGTEVKSANYQYASFTGRDDTHFTYNAAKAETVTVAGDGSTVLNVYYTRKTYTLKFRVLDCDKWLFHSHDDSCYKKVATITAKYDAKISDEFNKAPFTTTYNGRAWECTDRDKYSYALQTLDRMPGFDATFNLYDKSSNAKKTIYYYVQKVGTTVNANIWPRNANNFDLLKQVDTYFNYATYNEEYHEIQGFTRYSANVAGFSGNRKNFDNNRLNLYYMRNSYTLKFYNHDGYVTDKDETVQYEAPLSSYNFVPEYPANLEANAYEFAGWYTTSGCYAGSEADLNTMTMPASRMILYAKWAPVTHTVKTYLTKDVLDNGGDPLDTWSEVPHGTVVTYPPTAPENGQYTFVGWFYTEDGVEKPFNFSMPVTKDLELYAKWSTNAMIRFIIHYVDENGNKIADDYEGQALAGTTQTFDAKLGNDLYEGYREGYYPRVSSSNLDMDINQDTVECTFVYESKPSMPYIVRYLEKGTEKVLHEQKKEDTKSAIVTEKFVVVPKYRPDAYQKQLVITADEAKNVITFWYERDTTHAPLHVVHWVQNIEGDEYTLYSERTDLNAVVGAKVTENPLSIDGFTYNPGKSTNTGVVEAGSGLELNLYYDRNTYPYLFKFVDKATDKKMGEAVSGVARYQAQVTERAKQFPGYTCVSGDQQTISIAIESPATDKNLRIFYYDETQVTIHYVAVTEDGGSVSLSDETIGVLTGDPKGSAPTAKTGYVFVGWYTDEECAISVNPEWVDSLTGKIVPKQSVNLGTSATPIMVYAGATYYAKFVKLVNVTVTKEVTGNLGDKSKDFKFVATYTVNGESKSEQFYLKHDGTWPLQNIPVGTVVTITEDEYSGYTTTNDKGEGGREATITVAEGENSVTFTNNKQAVPDTGVLLDSLPYVVILAVVVLGAALVIVRRRKHRDDD